MYNYYNFEDPPVMPPEPERKKNEDEEMVGEEGDDGADDADADDEALGEDEGGIELVKAAWHPEFPRPSKDVEDRLLIRPEDTLREIDRLFFISKNHVQKTLNEFLEKYPSTHVIKIDGNCTPIQMFSVSSFC